MYSCDKRRKVRNSNAARNSLRADALRSLCVCENLWIYWIEIGEGGGEIQPEKTSHCAFGECLVACSAIRAMLPFAYVCLGWFAAAWLVRRNIGKVSMRVPLHGHGRRSVRSGILDNLGINLALPRRKVSRRKREIHELFYSLTRKIVRLIYSLYFKWNESSIISRRIIFYCNWLRRSLCILRTSQFHCETNVCS